MKINRLIHEGLFDFGPVTMTIKKFVGGIDLIFQKIITLQEELPRERFRIFSLLEGLEKRERIKGTPDLNGSPFNLVDGAQYRRENGGPRLVVMAPYKSFKLRLGER